MGGIIDRQVDLNDDQQLADFFRDHPRVDGKRYCQETLLWLLCVAEYAKADPSLDLDASVKMASSKPWRYADVITDDHRRHAAQRLPRVMKIVLEKDMDLHDNRRLLDLLDNCLHDGRQAYSQFTILWLLGVAEYIIDNPALGMGAFYELAMTPPRKRRWSLVAQEQRERAQSRVAQEFQACLKF